MKSIELPRAKPLSTPATVAHGAHQRNSAAPRQMLGLGPVSGSLNDATPDFKSSLENLSVGKEGRAMSLTGGEDQTGALAPHPLVQVVDDFAGRRQMHAGDCEATPKPTLTEFIARFESEMKSTEIAFKQQEASQKRAHSLYQRGLSQVGVVGPRSSNN